MQPAVNKAHTAYLYQYPHYKPKPCVTIVQYQCLLACGRFILPCTWCHVCCSCCLFPSSCALHDHLKSLHGLMKGAEAPFPGMAQRLVLGALSTSAEPPSAHVRLGGHTTTSAPWTQKAAILGTQSNGIGPVEPDLEQPGHRVTRSNVSDTLWEVSIRSKMVRQSYIVLCMPEMIQAPMHQ